MKFFEKRVVRWGKYVLTMELFAEGHRCNTLGLRRALISPALPSSACSEALAVIVN